MGLESATYVNDLTTSNPLTTDLRKQGDDHLRLIKTTLKNTFPNSSKAFYFTEYEEATANLTVVAADMNRIFGATTAGGAFQITLPVNLGAGAAGFYVLIVKLETNSNAVTVAPTSGTINGAASLTLTTIGNSILAIWTGTTWIAQVADIGLTATTSVAGIVELATAAEFRSNDADRVLSTNNVWSAAEPVALTPGTNVAVDLDTGINFTLAMGGNYTLDNPTNAKPGQSGWIAITQDGGGNRTLAYGTNWKFVGGTDPVLSTAAGTLDILYYTVISASVLHATLVKAIS